MASSKSKTAVSGMKEGGEKAGGTGSSQEESSGQEVGEKTEEGKVRRKGKSKKVKKSSKVTITEGEEGMRVEDEEDNGGWFQSMCTYNNFHMALDRPGC